MFNYETKVYPVQNPKSKIVAYASLLIEGVFEVTGFKIFQGASGLFVKPPQHLGKDKDGNDTWYDDARFVGDQSKDIREEVFSTMVGTYNSTVSGSSRSSNTSAQNNYSNSTSQNNSTDSQQNKGVTRRPLW